VLDARGVAVAWMTTSPGRPGTASRFTAMRVMPGLCQCERRRDALAGPQNCARGSEAVAQTMTARSRPSASWAVAPGAANVVPGQAVLTLDVRDPDDGIRIELARQILEHGKTSESDATSEIVSHRSPRTLRCPARLALSLVCESSRGVAASLWSLASGAGHYVVPSPP